MGPRREAHPRDRKPKSEIRTHRQQFPNGITASRVHIVRSSSASCARRLQCKRVLPTVSFPSGTFSPNAILLSAHTEIPERLRQDVPVASGGVDTFGHYHRGRDGWFRTVDDEVPLEPRTKNNRPHTGGGFERERCPGFLSLALSPSPTASAESIDKLPESHAPAEQRFGGIRWRGVPRGQKRSVPRIGRATVRFFAARITEKTG